MNSRIKKLRNESLTAINTLSSERAKLVTEFYKSDIANQVSIPVKRAMTFKHSHLFLLIPEFLFSDRAFLSEKSFFLQLYVQVLFVPEIQ